MDAGESPRRAFARKKRVPLRVATGRNRRWNGAIIRGTVGVTSGTKLGPYEIHSSLGAGGMGEVYRARDTRLERDVAIKVLPTNLASELSLKNRSTSCSRNLQLIKHPLYNRYTRLTDRNQARKSGNRQTTGLWTSTAESAHSPERTWKEW